MSLNCETPIDYSSSKTGEINARIESDFCNNKKNDENEIGFTSSSCTNNKIEVDSGCGSSTHSNNSNHSGSDDDTNDNNDKNDFKKNSDKTEAENEKKRHPKCARCRNHGSEVPVKGHKRKCPFRECICEHCVLTDDRRTLMAKTIAVKRRQNEDIADNTYVPPKPIYRKRLPEESMHSNDSMSNNSKTYLSESSVEEVFEFLIDKIDLKQDPIRKIITEIDDKTHLRNQAFPLLVKVLSEHELKVETKKKREEENTLAEHNGDDSRAKSPSSSKHGAFNIVYNPTPPSLSRLEVASGQNLHSYGMSQLYSNTQPFPSPPYTPHSYSLMHPIDSHVWNSTNVLSNPFSHPIPKPNQRSCARSFSSDISLAINSHTEDNMVAGSSKPPKCRAKEVWQRNASK